MRKFLSFFTVMSLLASHIHAQQKNYSLSGTTNAADGKWIFISYRDADTLVKDSALVSGRRFTFSGTIPSATLVVLYLKNSYENYASIFIEPTTMQAYLDTADVANVNITGSKTQDEYKRYYASRAHIDSVRIPLQAQRDMANNAFISVTRKKGSIDVLDSIALVIKAIDEKMAPIGRQLAQHRRWYQDLHPQSIITAYDIDGSKNSIPLDSLRVFYERLGKETQQTKYGRSIAAWIEKKANAKPVVADTSTKNFSTVDIDGKPLRLTDFRGKYVLLDFWGSWCVPCREMGPYLKEVYAQYRSKGLEIIGIAADDGNESIWKAAIKKDGLPWKHVLDGYTEGKETRSLMRLFDNHVFPTYILIDPSGKIAARFTSSGDATITAMNRKLAELIQ